MHPAQLGKTFPLKAMEAPSEDPDTTKGRYRVTLTSFVWLIYMNVRLRYKLILRLATKLNFVSYRWHGTNSFRGDVSEDRFY
jgi:hypothetical protein